MKIVKLSYLILAITTCCTFKTSHAELSDPQGVIVTTSVVPQTTEKSTHSINNNNEEFKSTIEKSEIINSEQSNVEHNKTLATTIIPHSANQSEKATPYPVVEIKEDVHNKTPLNSILTSTESSEDTNTTDRDENVGTPNGEGDYKLEETSESYDFNATSQTDVPGTGGRIYGAALPPPAVGAFPFAAVVTTPNIRTCTGALITTRFVLVPASCVAGSAVSSVAVATVSITGGTAAIVSRKIVHPKYTISPKDYNIALLRLSAPVAVSADVIPIQLATKRTTDDNKDIAGQQLRVVGYGPIVADGDAATKILRFIDLTVLPKSSCYQQTKYDETIPYSSKQSCLANTQAAGLCGHADLGALVLRGTTLPTYTLVGIVTYIHGCGSNVPSLFTRVGQHYDWIQKVIATYENNEQ